MLNTDWPSEVIWYLIVYIKCIHLIVVWELANTVTTLFSKLLVRGESDVTDSGMPPIFSCSDCGRYSINLRFFTRP